ncbi:MAG TPA: 8-amino-7-oxononanoate synthase [Chthoniobacterales bacterium]|nr:8-amino-7-oxononanoate synthase [Chthoniobacterales bacterium]
MSDWFAEQLDQLRERSLDRHLREISSAQGPLIELAGKRLINFSSNDYLGLANDARLRDAAMTALKEFGVGTGASRLVSGTQSPHVQLEAALANWKGTEAALTFSSGYAAALGTIPALVTQGDVVVLDKLCHASLIDGAKLSGAILRVFPHSDMGKLESHLQWAEREHPGKRVLVVTESVFSMDGDRAPLREIVELKTHFGALLLLDEAHAVGVLGRQGRGLAATEQLNEQVDVQMGTLSKALGVTGGYICGSRSLIDWLINRARSFIYSTAPLPSAAAAARAAVEFLASRDGETRREQLWRNIDILHDALSTKPASAILPWIIGDEKAAVEAAATLRAEGFLVPAIRYPSVAKGSARLRITVTAAHSEEQIRALCAVIAQLRGETQREPITV